MYRHLYWNYCPWLYNVAWKVIQSERCEWQLAMHTKFRMRYNVMHYIALQHILYSKIGSYFGCLLWFVQRCQKMYMWLNSHWNRQYSLSLCFFFVIFWMMAYAISFSMQHTHKHWKCMKIKLKLNMVWITKHNIYDYYE